MLLSYLRRHLKTAIWFACVCLIFALVLRLYDLPAEPVLYAGLLCLCAGAVFFAAGWMQAVRRHRRLTALRRTVTVSLEELPAPRDALEEDYQALLRALWDERARIQSAEDARREDERAYYLNWTHQIKVPLAALRLLLREDEEQGAEKLAELVKLETYADMALQYQRLGSGGDLLLRQTALDPVVRGVLRKYARLFILRRLSVDFRETGLTVLTDEKWLELALSQILTNALKYTPRGTIRIRAEGQALLISDPGIGIRPEDLPRVCECGFTGYNGRADKKSTGIGLYLCKRALEQCGHGLRIDSAPGCGTTVTVDFSTHKGMVE